MPSTKRMLYCFWCGEKLGLGRGDESPYETCGGIECDRHARYEMAADDADARAEAERDNYDRYR